MFNDNYITVKYTRDEITEVHTATAQFNGVYSEYSSQDHIEAEKLAIKELVWKICTGMGDEKARS